MNEISFAYFGDLILHGINLVVRPGEMVGLLGPNGSGKTTLLKLASGILRPQYGEIRLNGHQINQLNRKHIAQSIAVVPQQFSIPFAFTVREVVLLGRIPFLRPLAGESQSDRQAVTMAMQLVGIDDLALRRFDELSGGERQKVILAMALAQQPELLLLDEPTVHLDITHQIEILELIREFNRERGLTIVAAMHDLNLAALYFDRLILLNEGRISADGTPIEVLTKRRIQNIFATDVRVETHPTTGTPHIVILPRDT